MLNPVRRSHAAGAHDPEPTCLGAYRRFPPTADTDVEVDLWAM
jgi:hypothetical protein